MDVIKQETGASVRQQVNCRGMTLWNWLWACDITHLEVNKMAMWKKRELLHLWLTGALPDDKYGNYL